MVATPERARSPSSIREPLQNINSLPFRWRDNSPLAHHGGVTKREWISPSKPQWIERDTCTYTGIGGSVAGTTPLHHSSYFIFQDQDIRRRFHSGRPHLTDNPSIITTYPLSNTHTLLYLKPKNTYAYQYLKSPWFKSMAKQILSIEFKSIIKAHDSNLWRFIQSSIFISNIKTQFSLATSKPNSYWQHQSPIFIDNIKTQFLLATSKSNSYWQHQSPIFIGTTLSKRKKPKIINAWQGKNIMVKCYRSKKGPWQSSYEETHWKLSWGLCSRIINPWNTWTSFPSRHP